MSNGIKMPNHQSIGVVLDAIEHNNQTYHDIVVYTDLSYGYVPQMLKWMTPVLISSTKSGREVKRKLTKRGREFLDAYRIQTKALKPIIDQQHKQESTKE